MMDKKRNVFKDFFLILLPICYISIIPFILKVWKGHNLYEQRVYLGLQSIFLLLLGCFLVIEVDYFLKNTTKRAYVCVAFGLLFSVIYSVCYLTMVFLGWYYPYVSAFVRRGDMQTGLLMVGVYSTLLMLTKRKGK